MPLILGSHWRVPKSPPSGSPPLLTQSVEENDNGIAPSERAIEAFSLPALLQNLAAFVLLFRAGRVEWRGHPSTCSLASLRARQAMHRLRSDAGPDLSVRRRLLRFGVASAVNKILGGKNARDDCSFSVDPSKDESHKRGGADYTRQSAEHVQACLTRTTERSDPSITPRPSRSSGTCHHQHLLVPF